MLEAMETADDDVKMKELRRQCERKVRTIKAESKPPTAVDRRLSVDDKNVLKPYTLMAHKTNYFLFASYNACGINPELFQEQYDDPNLEFDNMEAKFQISIKMPLAVGLFDGTVDIFGAYTSRSFWQAYNAELSRPFRETDHEPEIWFQLRPQWEFSGFEMSVMAFGINHQSNGQGGVLSRSWDRLFARFIVVRGNWVVSLMPWYRLPEDIAEDDNPDITDYLGHFEIRSALKVNRHTISLMLRNNLESGFGNGAVELAWSFPILNYRFFRGYLQYFNGYGESLIDYNQFSNSIGIGISITDAL
jgi:phospholipase A1